MKKQKENFFLILLAGAAILAGATALYLPRLTTKLEKPDLQTQKLSSQSSSDEVSALVKDIMETNLSDLDQELQQIEAELSY